VIQAQMGNGGTDVPILSLGHWCSWVFKTIALLSFSRKRNTVHCTGSWMSPMPRPHSYGEEKFLFPPVVFILRTVPPAESIGRISEEFWICGSKQTVCIGALQQRQRAKNARTTRYVNRPLSELWINLGKSDTQNGNTDR
jgi:hypothetical protein